MLSLFLLAVLGIQGFHVIEHIVLVVQIEALGMGVQHSHGLLGARVDFEWLHFWYNLAFLGALGVLFAYSRRLWHDPTIARPVHFALAGAVGLQTYHVGEHVVRMVQYFQSDCTPCIGLIGHVVPFFWPHLFFGLFSWLAFVVAYFGYGLHRHLDGS